MTAPETRAFPEGPSLVSVPVVCETPGCPREGRVVNRVSGLSPDGVDAFYEGFDGSEREDVCPDCGEPGVAGGPEPQRVPPPSARDGG